MKFILKLIYLSVQIFDMNASASNNVPQTFVLRSNGTGAEGSISYEVTESGLLAKIFTVDGSRYLELFTGVPGLSDAPRVHTENLTMPAFGIEVNANGIQAIVPLSGPRPSGTPVPETPAAAFNGPHQPMVPSTPLPVRLAGPDIMLNRTESLATPSPTFPESRTLVRLEPASYALEDSIVVEAMPSRPRLGHSLLPTHAVPSFRKESSPAMTEIVHNSEEDYEEARTPRRGGLDNGYGLVIARNNLSGARSTIFGSSTPFLPPTGNREGQVLPDNGPEPSRGTTAQNRCVLPSILPQEFDSYLHPRSQACERTASKKADCP